ncbi:NAD-dependent epimerase/dehydratase family protein [Anaeromicrobium sediminis]|uniref:NAD-dependent epimerase/dehydratase family protein n=1 Tax=Anaeromicrobium sediminis TaxID=1478221 RepID=UPI001A9A6ADF|nr:NAD-dependent epimerase/dehydratase family protein [Anaeromicrobium sediminis]
MTGCAGFIGSHLSEALIDKGFRVIGIDCFTEYYDRKLKERNLSSLLSCKDFTFMEEDLMEAPLELYLKDIDYVFHQAGQPGVRGSWGAQFDIYVKNNVLATQRLLEIVKDFNIKKFIYASSSSIYGNVDTLPMKESQLPRPFSPYGMTKLAAEQLCNLYFENYGVPTVALRYFTVYGPRQRPEMAMNTFIKAILNDTCLSIYGDGNQRRDFTYIDDIVKANLLAMESSVEGEVFNVGSNRPIKLIEVIRILEKIVGKKTKMKFMPKQEGDVRDTYAHIKKIKESFGYEASVDIEKGLANQVDYIKSIL